MNSKQFIPIVQRIASLIKHDYKEFNLRDEYFTDTTKLSRPEFFLDSLSDMA